MTDSTTRVKLDDIIEGMDRQSEEINAYLHRPTGEVLVLSDGALAGAEEGISEDAAAWYKEEIARAQAFLEHEGEYIALPDRFEIDEYGMMAAFAESLEDTDRGDQLLITLRGQGAFRRFKDLVLHFGIEKEWYAYRDGQYVECAKRWCEDQGIEYELPEDSVE